MSQRMVVASWKSDGDFATWYANVLAETPFAAFYWEMPPITDDLWNQPFECVLVDAPQLVNVSATPNAFEKYFASGKAVLGFENLGGDAYLIAPAPDATKGGYPHLASFLRRAPTALVHHLWQVVAVALENRVTSQPLWCSTSGLGVHWLHVRLDSYPKYYTHKPYRRFPFTKQP